MIKLNLNMDPKEKQKLYGLFAIFGLAFIVFFYNLILRPQFAEFLVMNREYHKFKTEVRNEEALIANQARIKKQHENIMKEARTFQKQFPAQDEISSLLEDFSGIAESSSVKILKIMPMENISDFSDVLDDNAVYYEFPILIEARAGYHECGEFINKLENMDRFIKIDEVDIKGRKGNIRSHNLRLKVITYVIK